MGHNAMTQIFLLSVHIFCTWKKEEEEEEEEEEARRSKQKRKGKEWWIGWR
jgi:nicotinamide riboside transporter PnuC